MGSMQDIIGMLPGVDSKALAGAKIDERQPNLIEAIILSMTLTVREDPSVLNSCRKKRLAAGSGTSVVDVNRLLCGSCQIHRQEGLAGASLPAEDSDGHRMPWKPAWKVVILMPNLSMSWVMSTAEPMMTPMEPVRLLRLA